MVPMLFVVQVLASIVVNPLSEHVRRNRRGSGLARFSVPGAAKVHVGARRSGGNRRHLGHVACADHRDGLQLWQRICRVPDFGHPHDDCCMHGGGDAVGLRSDALEQRVALRARAWRAQRHGGLAAFCERRRNEHLRSVAARIGGVHPRRGTCRLVLDAHEGFLTDLLFVSMAP
jgi:hypothetical protein